MVDSGYSAVMEGRQIRAARAMLGLAQEELCRLAGITKPTLRNLENDAGDPKRSSLQAVERALVEAGIIFLDDGERIGVLLRRR